MELSQIKPYEKNAKKHPQKQVEQIAKLNQDMIKAKRFARLAWFRPKLKNLVITEENNNYFMQKDMRGFVHNPPQIIGTPMSLSNPFKFWWWLFKEYTRQWMRAFLHTVIWE